MKTELRERTADTVRIYFQRADNPIVKKYLPQKAGTVEEEFTEDGIRSVYLQRDFSDSGFAYQNRGINI